MGLWLHDDGTAALNWSQGVSDEISYWLVAQDNPPDPARDLGLRSGLTFLDFESGHGCTFVKDAAQSTGGSIMPVAGYGDLAHELRYDIGTANGNWAQIRCDFDPPLDLATYDHLRFEWRGSTGGANSLEVGIINPAEGGGQRIFGRGYHHATHRDWWARTVVPFSFLHPWTEGTVFDPSKVNAIFFSVVKDPKDDVGGTGQLAIDNLGAFSAADRSAPSAFEQVAISATVASQAATWISSQQQPSGLVKSWEEEATCVSHIYDQALALLVFINEGMWSEADALVAALGSVQNNDDGSWFTAYDCANLALVTDNKWEGDIAWAIFALSRYVDAGGTDPAAISVRNAAADWLASRIDASNGCLVIDHTEGTIDVWLAFHAAGPAYADDATDIRNCLLSEYWDDSMGRFKGGMNWWQPYLDNQTWGAAFLMTIGEEVKARRALSYAKETLMTSSRGGHLYGFDGQGGPWSLWNEGTAQYVTLGGEGANDLFLELLAQQRKDGAMPNSPDDFAGAGVWTTKWHGIAPTAWYYFAAGNNPFYAMEK